jgi:hypothetical protein
MKQFVWFVWVAGELVFLIRADWGGALLWGLVPAMIGIVLLVNDWCLAPLRRGIQEEQAEILTFAHPDPTMPDPLPGEDEQLAEIEAKLRRQQIRRVK